MSFFTKVKIRPADKLFSEYIRRRDGDCVYKVRCLGHKTYKELQCSHFHSRRKESVRFDPRNADAACVACHLYATNNPDWLRDFKRNQLGEDGFNILQFDAEQTKKRDDFMDKAYCKILLTELSQP